MYNRIMDTDGGPKMTHSAHAILAAAYGRSYNFHTDEDGFGFFVSHADPSDRVFVASDDVNLYRKRAGHHVFLHIGGPACECFECATARRALTVDSLPTVQWSKIAAPMSEETPEEDTPPTPQRRIIASEDCSSCDGTGFVKTGKRGRPPRCKVCNFA